MLKRVEAGIVVALLGIGGYAGVGAALAGTENGGPAAPEKKGGYFVFLYRPGPAWVAGKPVQEQPALAEHIAYMNKLEERGELVLGGPFKDDLGAMGVLEAESLEAATKVTLSDPLVRGKVVTVEVHPWHPAAQGCVTARTW